MSLFTSSAPTYRATVAYFLAIFVLLGGLASLRNHGDLAAMSNKIPTARSIVQDNAEFSWDLVRSPVDLLNCLQSSILLL